MLVIIAIGQAAVAQDARERSLDVSALGAATVADSERYRIVSKNVGKPFFVDVIRIDVPFAPPAARLPVVFAPDGSAMGTLIPAVAKLAVLDGLPSMLVVSISYDLAAASPAEAGLQGFARRFTDFTPNEEAEAQGVMTSAAQQMFGAAWPDDAQFGRADAFLGF